MIKPVNNKASFEKERERLLICKTQAGFIIFRLLDSNLSNNCNFATSSCRIQS